jgi:hypothetical protein
LVGNGEDAKLNRGHFNAEGRIGRSCRLM